MNQTTILIVDDHTLVREAWAMAFNSDPRFSVIGEAGTGEEGVELASILNPDIIIMDINLPGINGIEAAEKIIAKNPAAKILGVSLHTQPTYAKKMMSKGARGYVTKNSSREEMFQALESLLNGEKYICQEVKSILSEQMLLGGDERKGLDALSPREIEVISLLKEGLSSKEIGEKLFLSEKTVQIHRYNILKKLNLKNTALLIDYISKHAFAV
ncbi:MAG TPA: response regulator transcription factor [Chitinophagaceae bacterium]|jgi:two-component system invasion response regulator UvrY|nr:response regulator transcription factor [Chitinophagaceae bacterium]